MKIIFLIIFFFFTLLTISTSRDTITPTQPLLSTQTLTSSSNTFTLGFFSPTGTSNTYLAIWFNNPSKKIIWIANRNNPILKSPPQLSLGNSTLSLTDGSGSLIWSAGNASATVAQLLDTGNFQSDTWQSFDDPTDTLVASMKLSLGHNLTAWKSATDPSSSGFQAAINADSDICLYSSGVKIWRNGPWDGIVLSKNGVNYQYSTGNDISFSFQPSGSQVVFTVTAAGKAEWSMYSSDSGTWSSISDEPSNQCDDYAHCGPNGVCDVDGSPICSCLQGYLPKNLTRWGAGDWGDGCVRKTPLDCKNNTDGFVTVSGAKLPESAMSLSTTAFSLDECKLMCLGNCSCSAYAMDGSKKGCVIWVTSSLTDIMKISDFQQDLYVRLAAVDAVMPSQPGKKKKTAVVIVVPLLGGLALLIACVVCFLRKRKEDTKRRKKDDQKFLKDTPNENSENLDVPIFSLETIEAATDYFRKDNVLGQGGFGTVYKGTLEDGKEIAVKRLAKTSQQGTEEFKNEVLLIAKLQNRNLVRLLGCCIQGQERMLVYEYLPNKSLDFFLFDKEKSALLDWGTRYQIIIGIARGLLYLHHDSRFRVIHRDLKASNILLDEGMHPKISDFGMARLFGGDKTDFNTRKVVGTYGYMSPEYAMEGIFSLKSDAFSYGVLLLEIISGKKNRGAYANSAYMNLVAHAWSLWNEGKALELVDETMGEKYSTNDALRCIKVGLLCVQEHPEDRPLMSSVIVMLGTDIASLPDPKQPGFVARTWHSEHEPNSSNQGGSSMSNDLTITLDPR